MVNSEYQQPVTQVTLGSGDGSSAIRRGRILIPVILLVGPVIELAALIAVGNWLGLWQAIGLMLAASLLGLVLLVVEGRKSWRSLAQALRSGRTPSHELLDGGLILAGGLALFLPGLVSDVIGLILLLPPSRALVRRLLAGAASREVRQQRDASGIIPGEAEAADAPAEDDVVVGRLLP